MTAYEYAMKCIEILEKWPKSEWYKFYKLLDEGIWPYWIGEDPKQHYNPSMVEKIFEQVKEHIVDGIGIKAIYRFEHQDMTPEQFEDWWDSYAFSKIIKSLDMSQYRICCRIDSLKFLEKKANHGE